MFFLEQLSRLIDPEIKVQIVARFIVIVVIITELENGMDTRERERESKKLCERERDVINIVRFFMLSSLSV
jgi:hypothetical protein